MPKVNRVLVKIPAVKPDCCADCPFVGIIPKEKRKKDSKKTHVCLVTLKGMAKRAISIRASKRDSHHPLIRPCDDRWNALMDAPKGKLLINSKAYHDCRIPYEQQQQYEIDFGD